MEPAQDKALQENINRYLNACDGLYILIKEYELTNDQIIQLIDTYRKSKTSYRDAEENNRTKEQ